VFRDHGSYSRNEVLYVLTLFEYWKDHSLLYLVVFVKIRVLCLQNQLRLIEGTYLLHCDVKDSCGRGLKRMMLTCAISKYGSLGGYWWPQ
jgi:hypothetical protein